MAVPTWPKSAGLLKLYSFQTKLKSVSASALEIVPESEKQPEWSVKMETMSVTSVKTVGPHTSQTERRHPDKPNDSGKQAEKGERLIVRDDDECDAEKSNLLDWWSKYYASVRAIEVSGSTEYGCRCVPDMACRFAGCQKNG